MLITCPKCGADRLKVSKTRNFKERLNIFFGTYPLRCRECHTRFFSRIWLLPFWRYARCPKCERMDLSTWSLSHYSARPLTVVKLRLGAKPFRCEYCRCNFASFRRLKEKFTFRRKRNVPNPGLMEDVGA